MILFVVRWATTSPSARPSRRSTTAACSARWPSGWRRSTVPSAFPSSSRAPSRWPPAGVPARWCWRCRRTRCGARPACRTCRATAAPTPRPRPTPWTNWRACSPPPSASCCWGLGLDAAGRARSIEGFAERFGLPVGVAWRRLECFDNHHPNFAGHVGWGMPESLRRRAAGRPADRGRHAHGRGHFGGLFGDRQPAAAAALVHVYPDAGELGRVFHPTLPIVADAPSFAAAVDRLAPARERTGSGATHPASQTPRAHEAHKAHEEYLAGQEPKAAPGKLNLNKVACHVRDHLPADACLTVGARQLRPLSACLSPLPRRRHQPRADRRLDGLRPPAAIAASWRRIPAAPWFASPATAASR